MSMNPVVGRNDPCPCGSGQKYKKCCMLASQLFTQEEADRYFRLHKIRLKSNLDVVGIKKAGKLVVDTLLKTKEMVKPGISTNDINAFVHQYTLDNGATPAPLNYRGFPKSVCTSVNEVVCHGIPSDIPLNEGDIINIDVTSILQGYYADANMTFLVGNCADETIKLVEAAKEALRRGLSMVKPTNTIGDIGWAIQTYAEGENYSVVREYIGHGTGLTFHEPPDVPHFGKKGTGVILTPGMVFTVEPMLNIGKQHTKVLKDNWTVITKDGSLSAQFEQTILVTPDGFESLTPYEL